MTYLVATTTYPNFISKLTNLISGAEADDFGTTCAVGDRWQSLGNGTIAQPLSTGYEITQEHRAGYWVRTDDNIMTRDGGAFANTFLRQTGIWSGWSASWDSIIAYAQVTVANTVAGNYSNATVSIAISGVNNAGVAQAILTATNYTPNAAGDISVTVSGFTMTMRIGDPSGILALNAYFLRSFTDRAKGGYDYWRGFEHALPADFTSPTATNKHFVFTTGNEIAGVEDTDWEICGQGRYIPRNDNANATAVAFRRTPVGGAPISGYSGHSAGIGIKTNTSLTGNRYEVKFKVYDSVGSIAWSSDTLSLIYRSGTWGTDGSTGVRYGLGGNPTGTSLCKPYNITQNSSTSIQMFISVKPDWLCVVLFPDAGFAGVTVGFQISRVAEDDPVMTRGCWAIPYSGGNTQFIRLGLHSTMEYMGHRGKGYRDGGRDWQTAWGRCDYWVSTDSGSNWLNANKEGFPTYPNAASDFRYMVTVNRFIDGTAANSAIGGIPTTWNRNTFLNGIDDRWPAVQYYVADNANTVTTTSEWRTAETTQATTGCIKPRGFLKSAIYQIPLGGYANGDELQESVSGSKSLLLTTPADVTRWHHVSTVQGVLLRQV